MILTDITFSYEKLKVYVGQGSKSCKKSIFMLIYWGGKGSDHEKYTISPKYTIPTETFSLKV